MPPDAPAGGLGARAEEALARLGDHVALVFDDVEHTAAALHERAARLAGGLVRSGVGPGACVVVCMTNCPEVLVVYAACWRAGAVPVPVMPSLTPVELAHVLDDSGAVLAVASQRSLPLVAQAASSRAVRVAVVGERTAGADLSLDELEIEPLAVVHRSDDDLAALLYTGGTTGRAKGVMLTHGGLDRTARARAQVFAESGARDLLLALPLSHVYGLLNSVTRMHLPQPGRVVLQDRFDAAGWITLAEEHEPDAAALVPSMLQLLLRRPLEQADLASLRYVTTGGAPLPVPVREQFERRVPSARVCDGYGCTEVTSTATMNPYSAPRSGSVGLPLPGVELQVVDDSGAPLLPWQDGEVCVRSPGVMAGYWSGGGRDDAATAAVVRDGWLHTGDVGHLDDDGYLYVVDRLKDVVIRGGFNVYPRDVEDVLLEHPAVVAAAVVGRPDELYGEEVVAFVQLSAPATDDELLAFAAERLAAHKRPREVRVVDAVPLTSVGKTDRKALRAAASAT
ncbi:MAG: class I adenylate-forming enzyme family protein [Actinomycetes bacterium]